MLVLKTAAVFVILLWFQHQLPQALLLGQITAQTLTNIIIPNHIPMPIGQNSLENVNARTSSH